MKSHTILPAVFILLFIGLTCSAFATDWYGVCPPLNAKDNLRRCYEPYDLLKLNCLGMNYCENLLDARTNIISYTHLNYHTNNADAWHLNFPDDHARFLECVAWEDQFSPVCRLELARRMVKGLCAAHLPGTKGYYSFRHRIGGKIFWIQDDSQITESGRLMVVNCGDYMEYFFPVGFRAKLEGQWANIEDFQFQDTPANGFSLERARSPQEWNSAPCRLVRHFRNEQAAVELAGRYWMSDDDKPLEVGFKAGKIDDFQLVIGQPGKPMTLLGDANEAFVHLPDGQVLQASSHPNGLIIEKPTFNYFFIRKLTAWASPGYSAGVLVMWKKKPAKIEFLPENGFGEIRLSYAIRDNKTDGAIWVYPYQWVNHRDMKHVFRSAENFLANGKMAQHGYPSQQVVNAAPAGLAAGAYLLAKYGDPLAAAAIAHASNALDAYFEGEDHGQWLLRVFFPIRASAWMIKCAKELNDPVMEDKYTAYLHRALDRAFGKDVNFDGRGWPSGWEHFNYIKALWLAYDATGDESIRKAWESACSVYTIDDKGIYRDGQILPEPGSFETYFGAHTLGVWGLAGKLDYCNTLIHLDVPSGGQGGQLPVKTLWNDAGAGPWAQDDANPEYVGLCLRGLNIPIKEKHLVPHGAYPVYDAQGNVRLTYKPLVVNPFSAGMTGLPEMLKLGQKPKTGIITREIYPDKATDKALKIRTTGKLEYGQMICKGKQSVVFSFELPKARGAGMELILKGSGYVIEASPDGKSWFALFDSWNEDYRTQSVDLSFLTGSTEQLMKHTRLVPPGDKSRIARQKLLSVEEGRRSLKSSTSYLIYKLDTKHVNSGLLEVMAGNGFRIEASTDGLEWDELMRAANPEVEKIPDAAFLNIADISAWLNSSGYLFVRLSDAGNPCDYDGKPAFINRLNLYASFVTQTARVRVRNVSPKDSFTLKKAVLSIW